jgi:hypothetical protein
MERSIAVLAKSHWGKGLLHTAFDDYTFLSNSMALSFTRPR